VVSEVQSDYEAAAQPKQPNLPGSSAQVNLSHTLSVFLFDWDDTLFPTSALTSHGPDVMREALNAVDTAAAELLRDVLSIPRSCVVILTNANTSWVYHSAETFLPQVNSLLRAHLDTDGKLSLISAHRDRKSLPEIGTAAYEEVVRRSKSEAVQPLAVALDQVFRESQSLVLQVIGVGDQVHDLAAAHALQGLMRAEDSFVKTVLMKPLPGGMELARQLHSLCRSVPKFLTVARSFHQSMQAKFTPSGSQATPTQHAAANDERTSPLTSAVLAGIPTPAKNVGSLLSSASDGHPVELKLTSSEFSVSSVVDGDPAAVPTAQKATRPRKRYGRGRRERT